MRRTLGTDESFVTRMLVAGEDSSVRMQRRWRRNGRRPDFGRAGRVGRTPELAPAGGEKGPFGVSGKCLAGGGGDVGGGLGSHVDRKTTLSIYA